MRYTPTAQIAVLAAICFLGWTPAADAYIDPTAAGAALQSAYVIMASALVAVAMVPRKVAAAFTWLKMRLMPGRPSSPSDAPTATPPQD
jgi:hypothetical protein